MVIVIAFPLPGSRRPPIKHTLVAPSAAVAPVRIL